MDFVSPGFARGDDHEHTISLGSNQKRVRGFRQRWAVNQNEPKTSGQNIDHDSLEILRRLA